jgi:hypothetical protein
VYTGLRDRPIVSGALPQNKIAMFAPFFGSLHQDFKNGMIMHPKSTFANDRERLWMVKNHDSLGMMKAL